MNPYYLVWRARLRRVEALQSCTCLCRRHSGSSSKAAQLNFVAHPHFICHIARQLLGIPLCHYSDDMWGFEPSISAHHAQTCVWNLMDLIGAEVRLLGVMSCTPWTLTPRMCGFQKLKYKNSWPWLDIIRSTNHLTSAEASSLHGAFDWVRSRLWGRNSRKPLSPCWIQQHKPGLVGWNGR